MRKKLIVQHSRIRLNLNKLYGNRWYLLKIDKTVSFVHKDPAFRDPQRRTSAKITRLKAFAMLTSVPVK
jgi:hypothetical protein